MSRGSYLESQDFWLDQVDGRPIDFNEALAGFAVSYCSGSLHVSDTPLNKKYFLLAKGLHCFSHCRLWLSVTWLVNAVISLWCSICDCGDPNWVRDALGKLLRN